MWSSVISFFHLAECFEGSSTYSTYQSFIPLCGLITSCCMDLPHVVYPFVSLGVWVISTSWLLRIMLLGTFVCKFLCGHMFLFLLGMYLAVQRLGQE